MPADLAREVARLARQRHTTKSLALIALARRGAKAEAAAQQELAAAYEHFMTQANPPLKGEAGRDLIRAIFGKNAIAQDSLL